MQRFRRLSLPFMQASKLRTNHDCAPEGSSSRVGVIPSSNPVKPPSRISSDANATRDTLSDSEAMPTSLTKRRRRLTKRRHPAKKPAVTQPESSPAPVPLASADGTPDLINELQEPSSSESFLTSVLPNSLEASGASPSSPAPLSIILEQDERSIRARTPSLTSYAAFGSITSQDRISNVQKEKGKDDSTASDLPRLPAATEVSETLHSHASSPYNATPTAGLDFPSTMVSSISLPSSLLVPPLTSERFSSSDSPPSPTETYDTAASTFEAEGEESNKDTLVLPPNVLEFVENYHSDNDSYSSSDERWSTPTPTLRTVDGDLDNETYEAGMVRGDNNSQEQNIRMELSIPNSEDSGEIFLIPVEELWDIHRVEHQTGSSITKSNSLASKLRVPIDHSPQSPENQDIVEKQGPSSHSPAFPPGLTVSYGATHIMLENQPDKEELTSEVTWNGDIPSENPLSTIAIDSSTIEARQPLQVSSKVDKEVQTLDTPSETSTRPNSVGHPPSSSAIALEPCVDQGTASRSIMSHHIKEDHAPVDEYHQPSFDMKSATAHELPSSQDSSIISDDGIQTNMGSSVVLRPVEELWQNRDEGIPGFDTQSDSNDHSPKSSTILPPADEFAHRNQESNTKHGLQQSSTSLVLTPVELLWRNGLPPGAAAPTDIEPVTSSIIDALKTAMALSPAAKVPSTTMMSSSSVSGRSTPGGLPEIRESEEEHEADGRLTVKARSSEISLQDACSTPQVENSNPAICQHDGVISIDVDTNNQDDPLLNKMQQPFSSSSATSPTPILTPFGHASNIDIQQSAPLSSSSCNSSGIITIQRVTNKSPSSPVPMLASVLHAMPQSASSSMATASTLPSSNSATHSVSSSTPLNEAADTPRARRSLLRSFSSFTRSFSLSTRSRNLNILRKREPNFNMISAEEYFGLVGTGWGIEPWNGRNSGIGSLALVRALEQTMRSRSLDSPLDKDASTIIPGVLSSGAGSQSPPTATQMGTVLPQSSRAMPPSTPPIPKELPPSRVKFGQLSKKLSKRRKGGTVVI